MLSPSKKTKQKSTSAKKDNKDTQHLKTNKMKPKKNQQKNQQNQEKEGQEQREDQEQSKKINELVLTLKNLQAEFENYKKRVDKEQQEAINYSSAQIISKLLPLIDEFETALKNASPDPEFVEGIKMIYKNMHKILESEGLRKIKCLTGDKFDPFCQEVLMTAQGQADLILEEIQPGYCFKDKILRYAKVKVGNGQTEADNQAEKIEKNEKDKKTRGNNNGA